MFDVDTFEAETHVIPWRISQNGLAWLGEHRVALVTGDQILLYDHETKTMSQRYQATAGSKGLQLVAQPVLGHPFLIFQDPAIGILCLNADTGETHLVQGSQANSIHMLDDGAFLLSSDIANSDQRGTWLGQFGQPEMKRVFAQPLLGKFESNRNGNVAAFTLASSNRVLVRAFNHWHHLDLETNAVHELEITGSALTVVQELD